MFIYLDESGDLGFDWSKPRTSAYFVITLLVCESKEVTEQFKSAVKKTLKNKILRKKGGKTEKELKGSKSNFSAKKYFHKLLPKDGWSLYSVCLNKKGVKDHLKSKQGKMRLYNFLSNFLLEKVSFPENLSSLNFVIDRCKNMDEIDEFNQYVENHLESVLPPNALLQIDHATSHENTGLQAVDLFCWGIARKNTHGSDEWYDLFRRKIAFETVYLQK